jgi:hypothetical protein
VGGAERLVLLRHIDRGDTSRQRRGFVVYQWTPSWMQHFLAAAMIVTSIYAWQQKDYFE